MRPGDEYLVVGLCILFWFTCLLVDSDGSLEPVGFVSELIDLCFDLRYERDHLFRIGRVNRLCVPFEHVKPVHVLLGEVSDRGLRVLGSVDLLSEQDCRSIQNRPEPTRERLYGCLEPFELIS